MAFPGMRRKVAARVFREEIRGRNLTALGAHVLAERPLVAVDVGALAGIQGELAPIASNVRAVGFDPDADECERLTAAARAQGLPHEYLPLAIGGSAGTRTFHITRKPTSSSLLVPNADYHRRFPSPQRVEVVRTVELETRPLEDVLRELDARPEFLKLDVHGVEEEILAALPEQRWEDLLAVHVELLWAPYFTAQPPIGRLHDLLRAHGLELYDFRPVRVSRRASFDIERYASRGQIAGTDGLYLRDDARLAPEARRRLAVVAACFDHYDVAAELLRGAGDEEGARLALAAAARPGGATLRLAKTLLRLGWFGQRLMRSPLTHYSGDLPTDF